MSTDRSNSRRLLRLESFLPYRINRLADTVSRSLSQVYRSRYGIAIAEWRVIATLSQFDRITAREIGERSQMHKTKVSRAVAALADRGLVAKAGNPRDKRQAILSLTEAGKSLFRELEPAALAFSDRLEARLSPDDRAALERILTALNSTAAHAGDVNDR